MQRTLYLLLTLMLALCGTKAQEEIYWELSSHLLDENMQHELKVIINDITGEGDGGTATVSIELVSAPAGSVTLVGLGIGDVFSWAPAQVSATVTIQLGDVPTDNTVFRLHFINPTPNDGISTVNGIADITIRDNPGASNDPHLMIQAPGLDIPLCFDFTGQAGQLFNLLQSSDREFGAFGRLRGDSYIDQVQVGKKNKMVYISITGITAAGRTLSWEETPFDDGDIRVKKSGDNKLDIEVPVFAVRVERVCGGDVKPFLNLFVLEVNPPAKGIIGHVLSTEYRATMLTEDEALIAGGGLQAVGKRSGKADACWAVEREGEGLYPGRKEDYIME